MKLTFWGAAQQVTGSMYLLELPNDYTILVDCGTNMDKKPLPPSPYGFFPFDASNIDLVLLTHAHIDHSGSLPILYKSGYEGQILCTKNTADLTQILLADSARLSQRKIKEIHGSSRKSKKTKSIESQHLYLQKQVDETMSNMVTIEYDRRFKLIDGVYVTFIQAGHLLGAAHIYLEIWEENKWKTICFSGDIGRKNYPLLPDPKPIPKADYLICETTYGERLHEDTQVPEEVLADVIQRTCIDISGRLIVPAFSVGRTQTLLYTLHKLYTERGFQPIKIFTDSPLAKESTKIYERAYRSMNKEAQQFRDENGSLFDFDNLEYVESLKASKAISNYYEPCIIISASGMVQGGRIEHHIAANISNPYATVLLVGYASEGTLGWALLNGTRKSLFMNGKEYPFLANIEKIDVFSGHGDQNDLLHFVSTQSPETQIFLTHGEVSAMNTFTQVLHEKGFQYVKMPAMGESFEL